MSATEMERRREARERVIGHLWLIDDDGSTVIRCRCLDMSANGLRLAAPLGYGLGTGRTYRLCSHPPGVNTPPGLGLQISREGKVVRTAVRSSRADDAIELGIALQGQRQTKLIRPDAPAAHA